MGYEIHLFTPYVSSNVFASTGDTLMMGVAVSGEMLDTINHQLMGVMTSLPGDEGTHLNRVLD